MESRVGREAPVAQLDRALPSEGRGQGFESLRVRHNIKDLANRSDFRVTPKPGGARRIAVGTALALTDYPWSLARFAAAEIADGAR